MNQSTLISEPLTDYDRCIINARAMAMLAHEHLKFGAMDEHQAYLKKQQEYLSHARFCKERDSVDK